MTLLINAIAHLLVDGVCAATLFGRLGGEPGLSLLVMLYSTLAFFTQGLVGIAADRLRRHAPAGAIAMIAVAAGYFVPLPPLTQVIVISLGNSLFHVAGGAMTLEDSAGRAGQLGVFVAPGAIGLSVGTLWPRLGLPMAAGLLLCAAALAWVCRGRAPQKPVPAAHRPDFAVIALLTASVAVRAIGGTVVKFPWNTSSGLAMALTLSVFAGKTAGGLLCDRVGARRAALGSVVPATLLIAFCARWMLPSLLGQFLLNLTMPIALWLLYRAMPDSPGFAFGLAASALWPGTLLGRMMSGAHAWIALLISFAFALAAILFSAKRVAKATD